MSETRPTGGNVQKKGFIAGGIAVAAAGTVLARIAIRRFEIREKSMQPALDANDWVLAHRRTGEIKRGSVVVVKDPTGSGMNLVKRVVGLPGEHMGIDAGRVTVNGGLLADRWASGATEPGGLWHVPGDHVWLLGDNRSASASDGRVLGPTPIAEIDWVVFARYWPRDRAGILG
ncbi:MAG: signal peptidase I [Acidimicrobiia bacterium]